MKLGILLTEGPFQTEHHKTATEIAKAALGKGHEVEMFLFLDGIYNAISTRTCHMQKTNRWTTSGKF
jgi:sulfur relay (sulfurtransferase) complex TusBCD TusD component (DsrE family)